MMFVGTESGYRLALAGSGTTPLPHIDVERDTGYLVRALLECAPGKMVLGAGEMISWSEMMKVWYECNNVQYGGFDPLFVDQFERFIPCQALGGSLERCLLSWTNSGTQVVIRMLSFRQR